MSTIKSTEGARGDDPFFLGDKFFEHVVLDRAPQLISGDALLIADGDVHRVDDGGAGVDGEAGGDLVEGDVVEENLEVSKGIYGNALDADLAVGEGVIAI
jgi:hypothetical protein